CARVRAGCPDRAESDSRPTGRGVHPKLRAEPHPSCVHVPRSWEENLFCWFFSQSRGRSFVTKGRTCPLLRLAGHCALHGWRVGRKPVAARLKPRPYEANAPIRDRPPSAAARAPAKRLLESGARFPADPLHVDPEAACRRPRHL